MQELFQPNILWRHGLGEVTKSSGMTPVAAEDAEPPLHSPLSSQPCRQRMGCTPSPRPFFSVGIQDLTIFAVAAFPVIVEIRFIAHVINCQNEVDEVMAKCYHRCLVSTKHSLTLALMGNILSLPSLTVFCHSYRLSLWLWLSLWVSRVS